MASRLEKLFWSVLAGAAIGLAGCNASEPPEDADADVTDPMDSDGLDGIEDIPPETGMEPVYGDPADV